MTEARVREAQRALNEFTTKRLAFIEPLRVDGDKGHATNERLRMARFYLGYVKSRRTGGQGDDIDDELIWRLRHPRRTNKRWKFGRRDVATGVKRRAQQRAHAHRNRYKARASGVGIYDGKPCANWLIPYLNWARDHGWEGALNSGWRDPKYSESLCRAMCGAPSCPGRCAGRSSNHSGSTKPAGAVDVTYYADFGRLMAQCPFGPKLVNQLGAADPVHYSVSGR